MNRMESNAMQQAGTGRRDRSGNELQPTANERSSCLALSNCLAAITGA